MPRRSQHEEIIARVTFTSWHPAEYLPHQVLRSAEVKTARLYALRLTGELHSLVSLVLQLYLLEDFEPEIQVWFMCADHESNINLTWPLFRIFFYLDLSSLQSHVVRCSWPSSWPWVKHDLGFLSRCFCAIISPLSIFCVTQCRADYDRRVSQTSCF